MKILLLLIVLSAFTQIELVAQPVLNNFKVDQAFGLTIQNKTQNLKMTGFAFKDSLGANVTWDFSKFAKDGAVDVSSIKVVRPSETAYASKFPNANAAFSSLPPDTSFTFLNISDTKNEIHGSVSSSDGVMYTMIYNDARITGKYPFKYQDTFSDDYSSYLESMPDYKITGSITMTYVGYGTLITPDYTASNVVLTKVVDRMKAGPTVQTSITYTWNDPVSFKNLGTLSITQTSATFSYETVGPNSIEEKQVLQSGIISPNPSNGNSLFQIQSSTQENATLEIINTLGQVIDTQNIELKSGLNSLEISAPATGIYSVNVRTAHQTWSTKWIVN